MNARQIMQREDFKRCESFHGHVCGGLAIGYVAAKAGMDWLREKRTLDEELVAIVETLGMQRTVEVLDTRAEDLFAMAPVTAGMPDKARIEPSTPCTRCGEPTMASKLASVGGELVCRGCL